MIERIPSKEDKHLRDVNLDQLGSPEQAGNYLAELLSQAENAYTMYRQAQKQVANGYKTQEQQLEKDYRKAEKRAREALDKALDRARKAREQAEQQAEEEFKGALARAEAAYQKSVAEGMKAHKTTVEQAWKKCLEGREEAWNIFQGIQKTGMSEVALEIEHREQFMVTPTSVRTQEAFGEKAVESFRETKVYW